MYDESNARPSEDPMTTAGREPHGFSASGGATEGSVPPPAGPPRDAATGFAGERSTSTGRPAQGATGYSGIPGYPGYASGLPPRMPPAPDVPVPWLAALLGLIPGVGAMYNGQFAKGLAHLAIFAVLVSLADHVDSIFGVFVAGWIFYQAFEAFHTARARRDGLPLPNAFGLNEVGDRLGFGKNWAGSASRPTGNPPPSSSAGAPPVTPSAGTSWSTSYSPPAASPDGTPSSWADPASAANWAGYVSPSAFANAPPPSPGPAFSAAPQFEETAPPEPAATSAWNSVPYGGTYSGTAPSTDRGTGFSAAAVPRGFPGRRFPVGAVLLIVLGGVFLLSNVAPALHLSGRWLLPILLATGSIWSLIGRVRIASSVPGGSLHLRSGLQTSSFLCALRLPVLLMALAVMFVFQAAGWLTVGQTWPLLLIVLGGLLLLERTLGRTSAQTGSVRPDGSVAAPGDLAGREIL